MGKVRDYIDSRIDGRFNAIERRLTCSFRAAKADMNELKNKIERLDEGFKTQTLRKETLEYFKDNMDKMSSEINRSIQDIKKDFAKTSLKSEIKQEVSNELKTVFNQKV